MHLTKEEARLLEEASRCSSLMKVDVPGIGAVWEPIDAVGTSSGKLLLKGVVLPSYSACFQGF